MRSHRRIPHSTASPVLLALALAALAGCSGSKPEAPAAPAATAAPAPPKAPIVGAILMQQDQFFRLNEAGMREAAASLGADLRVQGAQGALDKEVTLVETFVTQGVAAILVSPLSTEASVPALQRAHEAGVKVITYNNAISAPFPAFSIASDQHSLGATSGAAAKAYIETKLGGKAKVALVGFASQLPEQGGARAAGFKSALEGMPGVEIVAEQDAWEAPQAANVVGELLAKQPDVVWAANEGGTVGAVVAVRNAGAAGKVAVFGTDLSTQLIDFLLAEDGILQAVTAQAPVEMGRRAMSAAVQAARGEPLGETSVVLPGVLHSREDRAGLEAARASLEAAAK